jgi:malate permease and related proteins
MNFVLIVSFVLIGWGAKRKCWLTASNIKLVNFYVIWVCLPAIALLKLPELSFDWSLLFPALMSWLLMPFLAAIILLLAKIYSWPKNLTGCMLLVVCFGNTSFVGFPIIQAYFGVDAIAYALIYDQIGSFLGLAIVGNLIIAVYAKKDGETKPNSLGSIIIKVVSFPPFVALVIAILSGGSYLTDIIKDGLSIIALTLVPATMLLVGAHFNLRIEPTYRLPLAYGLVLKMLLAPSLAFVVLKLTGQSLLSAQVTLMEAAMPPMVTASILAINARLAPQLAAVAVGYGMLLALVVMPLVSGLSRLL